MLDIHGIDYGLGGDLSEDEITVIRGALDLSHKTATSCMTPLDKVICSYTSGLGCVYVSQEGFACATRYAAQTQSQDRLAVHKSLRKLCSCHEVHCNIFRGNIGRLVMFR